MREQKRLSEAKARKLIAYWRQHGVEVKRIIAGKLVLNPVKA